jgi:peptidoglycan/xylan/chitin deacetylase (PgdA/CDA1 family)
MLCARACNWTLEASRGESVIQSRVTLIACPFLAICFATLLVSRGSPAGVMKPELQPSTRAVAITVDDLPGAVPGTGHATGDLRELERINRIIPQVLKSHDAPAIGFVNEWKLQVRGEREARVALLQSWLDAGLTLGNHTYTHPSFWTTPLGQYESEVIRGEVVTQALMNAAGQQERYFRHPYLITGPTPQAKAAFETFLKENGYQVAPVTVDNEDYAFNDVLGAALQEKNEELASRTKSAYLAYMSSAFDYYEGVSRSLFHREIPQVLLIHDSELTAECLDELLTSLERRGYRFISLDEALADPAYATPDLFIGPEGFSWLIRWKLAFGQQADWQDEPGPPEWVAKMSNQIREANQTH